MPRGRSVSPTAPAGHGGRCQLVARAGAAACSKLTRLRLCVFLRRWHRRPRYALALGIGAVQAVLFVALALLPSSGRQLDGRWALALPVLVLGITAFLALGVIVGSYAKTPEAVAAVANCLMIPMAFLSGSFFPLDAMPAWMQSLSRVLPLRYLNDGVSGALTGGGTLQDIGVACAVLAGFALVLGAVALKTFRWCDKS